MAKAFWQKGIHFTCQRCGNCCKGHPAYVYMSKKEFEALAEHLNMNEEQMFERYTFEYHETGYILETCPEKQACVFFDEEVSCTIYPYRPTQCRAYPFWKCLLNDKAEWDAQKEICPALKEGGGEYYTPKQIIDIAKKSPI